MSQRSRDSSLAAIQLLPQGSTGGQRLPHQPLLSLALLAASRCQGSSSQTFVSGSKESPSTPAVSVLLLPLTSLPKCFYFQC